jgi:sphingomyelin phosphodiesterase acid-like 3
MTNARARIIQLALGAMLVFVLSFATGEAKGQATSVAPVAAGQFLMLSDLHFDPMADPRQVDRLSAAEPAEWQTILESSGEAGLGRYGADTNWMLLSSALRQAAETLPHPAFLLLPGDFLAHHFRRAFDAAATAHSDAAYRLFVRKTMMFLAQQLERAFPYTPILPALGNNDEVCGDFLLQPGGPFLADMLPIVQRLVGSDGSPRFDRDWTGYGNYGATVHGIRVLSVNTVFFSPRYRNACGVPGDPNPARATLAWLEAELAAAKQAQAPVWMVYHVPPGIDGLATLQRGACPDEIIPMWDQAYAEPFFALLHRYADTVAASFAGHTHMDDFRLIGDAGGSYAFTLITPALSPIFGQNPAFRTVFYDSAGGILDQTTYDLTNLPEATANGGSPAIWRAEYTFTQAWRLPRVDLPSLAHLYAITGNVTQDRDRWHMLFPVSSPVYWPRFSASGDGGVQAVRAFRCATGNALLPDYRQCYCGGEK